MASTTPNLTRLRSRPDRGSHSLDALQAIFKASPIAHCAYLHPGDGLEDSDGDSQPRILNLPLLAILRQYVPNGEAEDDDPEEGELVVYLHTYYGSRLVQAIKSGVSSLTISTSKMDGLVLGKVPKGHSVNYRSATIYGRSATVLSNSEAGLKEKICALQAVIDDVSGYNRTEYIGQADEEDAKRTALVRVRIDEASCKQRTGGEGGDVPPVEDVNDEKEWSGVVPCWLQFGEPRGNGRHADVVKSVMHDASSKGQEYAVQVAYAKGRIDGR